MLFCVSLPIVTGEEMRELRGWQESQEKGRRDCTGGDSEMLEEAGGKDAPLTCWAAPFKPAGRELVWRRGV